MKKYYYKDFAKRESSIVINESFDNQGFEEHTHDFFEIAYIKRGQGIYTENSRIREISDGDLIFVTPNDIHSLQPETGDFAWVNCLFLPHRLYDGLQPECTAAQILSLPCFAGGKVEDEALQNGILIRRRPQDFKNLMTDMMNEYFRAGQDFESVLRCLLHAVLIRIKRNIMVNQKNGAVDCTADGLMSLVNRFIPESSSLPHIDLTMVAQAAGLTPKYFSETFKKKVGISFTEYVRDRRLLIAARMLRTGTANVQSVMDYVGYRDYKTFYKLFKEKFGATPSEYRKKADLPE